MILVIGTVRLPPEKLLAARADILAMISASRAEEGCLEYSDAEDVLEPGLIHVKEVWTSREALRDHFAAPHLGVWRSAWPRLQISDRSFNYTRAAIPNRFERGDSTLCYCVRGMEFSKRGCEPSTAPP